MQTIEMEIDGGKKTVLVFESMWEYLEHFGATVEDYARSPEPDHGEKFVGDFKPIDDVFFGTHSGDMVVIDGKYYQHVNWGEDEYALVPESDLESKFYLIWERNEKIGGYDTRGQIFQTREEAEKEVA